MSARVLAPAKINLGLELLGKRPDGYHEIRTVMAMIGLEDEIRIAPSAVDECSMHPDLGSEQNLVAVARDRFAGASSAMHRVRIEVTKHIPFAGGLGGASADAAATLLALNALQATNARLSDAALQALAASLGSDVPFFLHGPLALASGTGTEIAQLSPLPETMHVVLIAPPIALPRKTATLYGTIEPSDFSDGERTAALADAIRDRSLERFGGELLANPFRAAWNRLGDPLSPFEAAMMHGGAPWVALSGAGPTLYTLVADAKEAATLAGRMRERMPREATVFVAPILSRGIAVEIDGVP